MSDSFTGAVFSGVTLALSGPWLAVGAPTRHANGVYGSVALLYVAAAALLPLAWVRPSDVMIPNDIIMSWGSAVALLVEAPTRFRLIVGAPAMSFLSALNVGLASSIVFAVGPGPTQLTRLSEQTLYSPTASPGDRFGAAVAVDAASRWLAVGAPQSTSRNGSVAVFLSDANIDFGLVRNLQVRRRAVSAAGESRLRPLPAFTRAGDNQTKCVQGPTLFGAAIVISPAVMLVLSAVGTSAYALQEVRAWPHSTRSAPSVVPIGSMQCHCDVDLCPGRAPASRSTAAPVQRALVLRLRWFLPLASPAPPAAARRAPSRLRRMRVRP